MIRIYKIIILFVVLYGCETWSLTLSEECRPRVFKNRVLRRRSGLKRNEVTRDWRKLNNEELHNLYSSPGIIRMIKSGTIRWAGHGTQMGKERNACRILVGKPEGKRPLGKQSCRHVDNIKMGLKRYLMGQYGLDSFGSG
jgi:hypothetical protein